MSSSALLGAVLLAQFLDTTPRPGATATPAATGTATPAAAATATATPSALDGAITPRPSPAAATPTPAPTATPPRKAAVLAVADDAGAAGDLQRELEQRLKAGVPGLFVRITSDVAMRVAVPKPPATPAAADPALAALMEQAIAAYYDAQYVKALDLFAKAQGLNEAADVPISRKTEVLLWRVAVYLGLNDEAQAQSEALAALTLNPELKVDPTSEIPPSVQQQLDKVKTGPGFKLYTVVVNGLPNIAVMTVDGRSVPSRFKVLAGKHRIVAASSGRREVTREIDVAADMSVSMALPPALSPEAEAAVRSYVWPASRSAAEPPEIAEIAQKLDVDWVVFAAVSGTEIKAVARRASGSLSRSSAYGFGDGPAKIVEELGERIKNAKDERVGNGPVVIDDTVWNLRTRGTLLASGWLRSVSGGETIDAFFGGAGPEVQVDATKGRLLLAGAASYVSYDASSVDVTAPDGRKTTATGGSTARLLAGGGMRFGGEDGGRYRVLGALDFENHGNSDAKIGTAKLNVLPGYTRAALEIRGGMRMPAPMMSAWLLDVELGVSPFAYYAENPEGASGNSPAAQPSYLWRAGLESAPSSTSAWGYRLDYAGELRSVRFKGRGDAAVSPPLENATLTEMYHALALSVTRRF